MLPKQPRYGGRRGQGAYAELISLIVRLPVLRLGFHACGGIHAQQLMVAEKHVAQLMHECKPDALRQDGIVIVDVP